MSLYSITSVVRERLPVLVAASVLLALSLAACGGEDQPAASTPAPASESIATATAEAVAAPAAEPTPTLEERIAKAVAAALTEVAADATPDPDAPTAEDIDKAIAEAVAAALAEAAVAPTPMPTPENIGTAVADPTPDSSSTLTPEEIAKINADAAALSDAVGIALDSYFNGPYRDDLEGSIAHAVSMTNADADAVRRAMDEVMSSFGGATPVPVDPAAKGMSEALTAAVTLALEHIIVNPNDISGAVAQAVSTTGADANDVATTLYQVLSNPVGFPNLDVGTAIDAANAVSEANALAAAKAIADAAEAARQAAADASAEQAANPTITPTPVPTIPPVQNYESWNDHEWLATPMPWWRPSNPYDCDPPPNPDSPWTAAGMPDLDGQDPLSLIRYFGNGSYVRYGLMGFEGCTFMGKHPERTHLDIPLDPTYYSLGDLEIAVDIARVPAGASEWPNDDGSRVDMSMAGAVDALNDNVAAYFRKISQGKLRMTFVAGEEFHASGRATPQDVENEWLALIGVVGCDPDDPGRPGCRWGTPGALNRLFLNDVGGYSLGSAWNGYADLGLVTVRHAVMPTLVHEIGHAWMFWPHSYVELPWRPDANKPYKRPNFYSNRHDFMSELTPARPAGWYQDMPATLAVNRYAAGWIEPEDVALHLSDEATYTLARPLESGYQFLVVHSGRAGAFTTLEVLDERNAVYRDTHAVVYDPASPNRRRPIRYEGVMVSRYDQTTGTGYNARTGPALHNAANPDYESDVGYGLDDFSVIADGESRSIGGGVTVSVTKNADGSYDVRVSGGKIAAYDPWCIPIWFPPGGYDTGCMLDDFDFGGAN